MRRIVTNFNQEGKSVFASEGKPQRIVTFESIPGFELNEIWATDSIPSLPVEKSDPTEKTESFVPNTGGTCFRIIRIPPEQDILKAVEAGLDMSNARQEYIDKAPGLGDSHEIENPGMHTTDTVDYITVISGEVWLELDDGAETHLKQGDCVVQNGTRHAWRNRGSEPCIIAAVMIGANRL
ncbi:MAG: cupin domain-containing protein [Desulfobacterales bacterium]|nr:cupin domain-containing protein [Desulfobacterales bacterium]